MSDEIASVAELFGMCRNKLIVESVSNLLLVTIISAIIAVFYLGIAALCHLYKEEQ